MGPRLFSRGNLHSRAPVRVVAPRFNGATALQPWKSSVLVERTDGMTELQWGHGSSAVEMPQSPILASVAPRRFNGATALQPWK